MTSISGRCYCGEVRFEVTPPSRFVAHCHCRNCQRAHGAPFVTWAGFPLDQLHIRQGQSEIASYETETGATRSFCRSCGSPLFYASPRWPEEIHVAVAHLDATPGDPSAHVYADRSPDWCPINDELPCLGGDSGMEPI